MALPNDRGLLEPETRSAEESARRLAIAATALFALLGGGTLGFHTIEGWSWFDSLYMVVISITTVGYSETHHLSLPGRIFAMLVILGGVGVGSYVLLTVTRTVFEGVVEGSLRRAMTRRRVQKEIPKLSGHTIVCGYGRLGEEICAQLKLAGRDVVIVDSREQPLDRAEAAGFLFVRGDAADEDVLRAAGIGRAEALAIATPTDAINTYIALTARDLNGTVHILSRASDDRAARRLERAGADKAMSPYRVGGMRMASMLLRPDVVDLLDLAQLGDFPGLFIESVRMEKGAKLEGKTLREAEYNHRYQVIVLSLKHGAEEMRFRPDPDVPVRAGDMAIMAGHRNSLDRISRDMRGPQ